MARAVTFGLVACLLTAAGSGHDHDHEHPPGDAALSFGKNANCAVASVCAALHSQGIDAPLAEILEHFPARFRPTDAYVPIGVVGAVLGEYGLPYQLVQFDPAKFGVSNAPALLLIHSSGDPAKGHYVLLSAVKEDQFDIFDPDNAIEIAHQPRRAMDGVWKGYAVTFGPSAAAGPAERIGRWLLIPLLALAAYNLVRIVSRTRVRADTTAQTRTLAP
ncbi:cysteine peptidase family C39 domain-containing protein [Singulisphaera rosea]